MSFRGAAEAQFVQRLFRNYYEKRYTDPYRPQNIDRREFGYTPFDRKIMVRHLSFRAFEDLRKTLAREAPLHVYRSAALYQYPQAPMEEKGWMGAELIFDIDADHLETSCKKTHDYFLCSSCHAVYFEKNTRCTVCNNHLTEVNTVCGACLGKAKKEMLKLLSFLVEDLGLDKSSMTLSFSGNRGYHLAVSSEEVMNLDRSARQEIVEYISGTHLDTRFHKIPTGLKTGEGPSFEDRGWAGRIARGVRDFLSRLEAGDEEAITKAAGFLKPREISNLAAQARYWRVSPCWHMLKSSKTSPQLQTLIKLAVEENASHVDTVVTTDLHRLLRLTDSLNGKTGLTACRVEVDGFESFDPLMDSVVLPDEPVEVKVLPTPEFELGGSRFGPYKPNEQLKLPTYAAVYLMCRGLAITVKH